MKLRDLMAEVERGRHRMEVYSLLERTLSEYVASDTEESPSKFLPVSGRCSTPFVAQDVIVDVLVQISTLKDEARAGLDDLQDLEVIRDEKNKEAEEA